jgi:putative phosphoribosyl transferase
MIFKDRQDAGRQLALRLDAYARCANLLVLGIPRGGVVVAAEVARLLHAPLDVFISAKLPVPGQEELAFGAIAEEGTCLLDLETIRAVQVSPPQVEQIKSEAAQRVRERTKVFRVHRPPLEVGGKTVILIDDGIATGASIHVSILALRAMRPAGLIVAAPVAPPSTCRRLRALVDELVCAAAPCSFEAVSQFYSRFPQETDDAVTELLRAANPTAS